MHYILWYKSFSDSEVKRLQRPLVPIDKCQTFDNGVLISNPPDKISFIMTNKERGQLGDYVPSGLPGLLVSDKFKLVLEKAGIDNVQYIDAEIVDEVSGNTFTNYYIANIIGVIDCIDINKSKLTMRAAFPDKIRNIDELHLDESRIKGLPLFRLARQQTLIICSEKLMNIVISAKLHGFSFLPAEGFAI